MEKGEKLKCADCGKEGEFKKTIWQFKNWDGFYVCQKCGDKLAGQHLDVILGM